MPNHTFISLRVQSLKEFYFPKFLNTVNIYFLLEMHPRFFHGTLRIGFLGSCGDPKITIRDTRYAYNSRSHDQCVMNLHIGVDNRITPSITLPNDMLTTSHMTKFDNATQGKLTTKQRIQSSIDGPRHAYYPIGN
jgi:hypothetical protein